MEAGKKNTKKIVIAVAVLAAVIAVLWGVYAAFGPRGTVGEKTIGVQAVFADGSTREWEITTDAEFLRGALEQEGIAAGEESEYGLFVKTVDGVTADDAKQEWWCFTKNGGALDTGVDTTPIADGDHFEITLTTGY